METPATSIYDLKSLCAGGGISQSSKADLERFAVMLSKSNAASHFGAAEFPQICETVRTLLIVRMSEDANKEATRISKIALAVAMAACGGTAIQLLAGLWPK